MGLFDSTLFDRQRDAGFTGWIPVGDRARYPHPCHSIGERYRDLSKKVDRKRYALSRARKDAKWHAAENAVIELEKKLTALKAEYLACTAEHPIRERRKQGSGL